MSARHKPSRKLFWSIIILSLSIIAILIFLLNTIFTQTITPVKTLLLITDPLLVVHLDPFNHSAIIVSLPADVVIDAAAGYGSYPVKSLWKLGELDNKPDLLSLSLGDALAIEAPAYLALNSEIIPVIQPVDFIKNTFSGSQLFSLITSRFQSSLNPLQIWSFTMLLKDIEPAKISHIDLASSIAITPQLLPDGSSQARLDPFLVDRELGDAFEDRNIRSLALRFRVDNPSQTLGVGAQLARKLSRLGIIVVAVGNSGVLQTKCVMEVHKKLSDSAIIKNLARRFDCTVSPLLDDNVVDARLILGENNLSP